MLPVNFKKSQCRMSLSLFHAHVAYLANITIRISIVAYMSLYSLKPCRIPISPMPHVDLRNVCVALSNLRVKDRPRWRRHPVLLGMCVNKVPRLASWSAPAGLSRVDPAHRARPGRVSANLFKACQAPCFYTL